MVATGPEVRDDAARARVRAEVRANRDVRRFLLGFAVSMAGTAMTPVALSFAILDRGGDAGDIGWVMTAESVPLVAFLLIGGVVSDRLPRQQVLVAADLLRTVSQGLLAVLLLTGRPSLSVMMALAAVLGVGQAFAAPAFNGVVPQIVPPEQLQPANALVTVAGAIGESIGPALAGVLIATVGAGWALGIDAATYGISAWCVAGLPMTHERREDRPSFLRELRDGWDSFRSRTWLWVVVLEFSFFHLLVLPAFLVVGAVVADESLGGAKAWGLVMGGFGAGMLVGGVVMFRFHPRRLLLLGVAALSSLALPIAALAIPAPLAVVVVLAFVAGLTIPVFETGWTTSLQQHVEPEALSRVSSYDWFGSVATLPIGFAIIGPISESLGDGGALWLAAGLWIVASAIACAVPSVRHLRAEPEPSSAAMAAT